MAPTDPETARALVYTGPGEARIETVALAPLRPGEVEIETTHSALSRGTERLVFEGRVPESEWTRMRAPFQTGDFPFPVRYGYAAVGRIVAGAEERLGSHVFALAPHQSRLRLPADAALPVPDAVPPARAVLAANAETALNAVWDADPGPGERVLVVGAGLLGLLIAGLLSLRGDVAVHICDVVPQRANVISDFRVTVTPLEDIRPDYTRAIHASATAEGLETALSALAFEGEALELSWYGDRPVPVRLGAAFHSQRLSIRSSQVGHIARPRRASTSHRERLGQALAALADPRFDRLVTEEVRFDDLPAEIPRLLAPGAPGIATRIVY